MNRNPGRLVTLAALLVLSVNALAAPRVPASDAEVLERLPKAIGGGELAALRRQWQSGPLDATSALALAERYVALGRSESDPRYYGYAEGVLGPLWAQAEPPSRALILRAVIRQARHDFTSAKADLRRVLARDPRQAQAWLSLAVIERVLGEYPAARSSCGRLVPLVEMLVGATCLAAVAAVDGHAHAAFDLLQQSLRAAPGRDPGVRQWAWTTLAEIAHARGQPALAEDYFTAARAEPARSVYLLLAYADFLLDVDRPREVLDLLADEDRHDGALLRLALAAQALDDARLPLYREALRARFAAARQRGDTLHQGEAARFALAIEGDARQALRLAVDNWTRQREPRDSRIVLDSALQAAQPDAARPVLEFLAARGTEDLALKRLTAALTATR